MGYPPSPNAATFVKSTMEDREIGNFTFEISRSEPDLPPGKTRQRIFSEKVAARCSWKGPVCSSMQCACCVVADWGKTGDRLNHGWTRMDTDSSLTEENEGSEEEWRAGSDLRNGKSVLTRRAERSRVISN
jgi:hypothetical protein